MNDIVSLERKKALLKEQKVFSNFDNAEIEVLSTLLKEVQFAPNEMIVDQGKRVDSVYIIVDGTADVMIEKIIDGKATSEKAATLNIGQAIGLSDIGFFSITGLRTATVVATSDVIALKLNVAMFRGFALAYPHASEVMRQQAESL